MPIVEVQFTVIDFDGPDIAFVFYELLPGGGKRLVPNAYNGPIPAVWQQYLEESLIATFPELDPE